MRGKETGTFGGFDFDGITPAYAGKSDSADGKHRENEDHPRICGEKKLPSAHSGALRGSPPHMRGKVDHSFHGSSCSRITPAYAGKSSCFCKSGRAGRDHPRICGEKVSSFLRIALNMGSPPHMRGKVIRYAGSVDPYRITPAYAGKSIAIPTGGTVGPRITPAYAGKSRGKRQSLHEIWDHPRICGEKSTCSFAVDHLQGSPPHMRGKGVNFTGLKLGLGITPAYAGKRRAVEVGQHIDRDHPRICGEKTIPCPAGKRVTGSPPHMRGKAVAEGVGRPLLGITPAYAGKSGRAAAVWQAVQDHPRICGEKVGAGSNPAGGTGSPPHMRGKD